MRTIRDCAVAVVGGAGFLGSHLVNHLIEDRGCKVLVIDNLVSGRREFVHPKAKFIYHDITQSEEYLRAVFHLGFRDHGSIRFLFNYAAWPYVPDSYTRPGQVWAVNATGAMRVVNAAQEAGVEAILQVSSAEVYGDFDYSGSKGEHNGISEDYPVAPKSSYGVSKAAIDAYCQVAWKERDTPVISLRQFNCVGERETHPYVVPEIITQLCHGGEVSLGRTERELATREIKAGERLSSKVVRLGNNSRRDFMYAGDAVRLAVLLLEKGGFGQVYNLGSEESVRIYDLAQMLSDIIGCGRVTIKEDQNRKRKWEVWHLQANVRKLWDALGDPGFALLPLKHALIKTVQHYVDSGRKWVWENTP